MRIARRLVRVEAATAQRRRLTNVAHAIAARYGVTVDEVFAEARRLREEAWLEGVTPEVLVARECGESVAAVRAEAARVLAAVEGATP